LTIEHHRPGVGEPERSAAEGIRVDERLQALLDSVRALSPPLGLEPWVEREERELAWGRTLSVADYFLLLDWMIDPRRPPNWEGLPDRHLAGYAANVAYFVGRAARNCRDERLLSRLLDLLADAVHGDVATDILFDMENSPAFDVLLTGAADQRVAIIRELAAVATPRQVKGLQETERSSGLGTDARLAIRAVLTEWARVAEQSRAEPNPAPDRGGR
jgi:hypothetical protein